MFRDGRLIVDSTPYKPIEANISLIYNHQTKIIASYLEDPRKTLLTFGTHYRLITGEIFCKLSMYGTFNDSIQSHIYGHIEFFQQEAKEFIIDFLAEKFDQTFHRSMIDLGLHRAPLDVYGRTSANVVGFGYPFLLKKNIKLAKL